MIELNPDVARRHRRARRRPEARRDQRPAAWHPDPAQGQHRHQRWDADHRRLARARRLPRAARRVHRRAAARGRRRDHRQGEPERVGEFPEHAQHQRLERARRAMSQSVCARSHHIGLELRLGRGRRRESVRRRHRHRDRRLDRRSLFPMFDRGHQAHRRTRQPERYHPHRAQPGHGGSDGAHGHRRGDRAERDRRRGSARPRDRRGEGSYRAGLHQVPRRERARGRTHWRAASALLRLQPQSRCTRGRGDRGDACRRRDRSSTPRRSRRRAR